MKWLAGCLICLSMARAARYGDYSGVKMPQYNMEYPENLPSSDEYKDHSPDAAPSLDYRYEEDSLDKVESEPQDSDWNKRSRKKKILKLSDDRMELNSNNKIVPLSKSNRWYKKHRPRTKEMIGSENSKYNDYDAQYDDSPDLKIGYPKKMRKANKVEMEYNSRYTTQKIIRRKVRDRTISQASIESDDSEDSEELMAKFDDDMDLLEAGRRRMSVEKNPIYIPKTKKFNLKNYGEDDEYYDMKRVKSQHRHPDLLRGTKVQSSTTEASSSTLPQDVSYRRVYVPNKIVKQSTEIPEVTISTIKLESTEISVLEEIQKQQSNNVSKTSDLSLAEKSRLSILRKSLKKESVRNVTWTMKPPVLLQVTPKMQTIVMVEPRNDIQMRAQEVFEDSSQRIVKAKKLMRHKLVSGARSIQDLTDNWDEMICDYIDVSLLDKNCSVCFHSNIVFMCVFFIYNGFLFI